MPGITKQIRSWCLDQHIQASGHRPKIVYVSCITVMQMVNEIGLSNENFRYIYSQMFLIKG